MVISRTLFLIALAFTLTANAAAQCSGTMNIVTPSEGAMVSSHFQIDATAALNCSVPAIHVYIDDRLQYAQYGQTVLSGKFNASLGTHHVVVQAWASDGKVFNKAVHVTVNKLATAACTSRFDPNVTVCLPANLTESKGAVLVQAAANSSVSPVVSLKTWTGSVLRAVSYNENATQMDAALTLPRGLHNINVVARTANGNEFQNQSNVQVVSASASCTAPFISNLRPTGGDEPEFPPFLVAADAAACPITGLRVYVDSRLIYEQTNQKLFEGRLTIEPGEHNVVLQAWNSQGVFTKKAIKINVFGLEEPVCVPDTDPGVTICQAEPADNGYVILFVGTPPLPASQFTALRLYVDNVSRATFRDFAAQRGITFLKMSPGTHTIVAVAWTRSGKVVTDSRTVTVP